MKATLGLIAGPITLVFLMVAGLIIHNGWNNPAFAFTLLIGIAGVSFGWLVGFLVSPYTSIEATRFSRMTTAIIGFLSGYVVSQVQPLISHLFEGILLFEQPVYGARLLIFLICLVIGGLNMYTYRLYIGDHNLASQGKDAALGEKIQ